MHDTEDRPWWYKQGEKWEREFLETRSSHLPFDVKLNPAKRVDATAPDLLLDGQLADLKCQRTPFFKVGRLKPGFDPRFTVSFNEKDRKRYLDLHPDIMIVIWVNWTKLTMFGIQVEPLDDVRIATLTELLPLLNDGALHEYLRRKYDSRPNAKTSYVVDIRKLRGPY